MIAIFSSSNAEVGDWRENVGDGQRQADNDERNRVLECETVREDAENGDFLLVQFVSCIENLLKILNWGIFEKKLHLKDQFIATLACLTSATPTRAPRTSMTDSMRKTSIRVIKNWRRIEYSPVKYCFMLSPAHLESLTYKFDPHFTYIRAWRSKRANCWKRLKMALIKIVNSPDR